ncbi:MAG TPA: hypothetical protein VF638_00990 [Sphingomonas sp.]|jgi:hypothetical protein
MIGSFGKPRAKSPYAIDESGALPQVGEYLPQQGPLAAEVAKKPGFFEGGGLGQSILNFALEAATGVPSAAHREQAETRKMSILQRHLAMTQAAEQATADRTRSANNQDFYAHEDYKRNNPMPAAVPAAVEIARQAGLMPGTPQWTAALTAAIPGYSYTAPVMQAKTQAQITVADRRAANSASLKSQPTYAQSNPRPTGGGRGGSKPAKLPTGFILD